MRFEVRTIVNGRRLFVAVKYKREVKKIIEDWSYLYEGLSYVDIRVITEEVKEVKVVERVLPKDPPAKVISWPKVKTWLERYG